MQMIQIEKHTLCKLMRENDRYEQIIAKLAAENDFLKFSKRDSEDINAQQLVSDTLRTCDNLELENGRLRVFEEELHEEVELLESELQDSVLETKSLRELLNEEVCEQLDSNAELQQVAAESPVQQGVKPSGAGLAGNRNRNVVFAEDEQEKQEIGLEEKEKGENNEEYEHLAPESANEQAKEYDGLQLPLNSGHMQESIIEFDIDASKAQHLTQLIDDIEQEDESVAKYVIKHYLNNNSKQFSELSANDQEKIVQQLQIDLKNPDNQYQSTGYKYYNESTRRLERNCAEEPVDIAEQENEMDNLSPLSQHNGITTSSNILPKMAKEEKGINILKGSLAIEQQQSESNNLSFSSSEIQKNLSSNEQVFKKQGEEVVAAHFRPALLNMELLLDNCANLGNRILEINLKVSSLQINESLLIENENSNTRLDNLRLQQRIDELGLKLQNAQRYKEKYALLKKDLEKMKQLLIEKEDLLETLKQVFKLLQDDLSMKIAQIEQSGDVQLDPGDEIDILRRLHRVLLEALGK